MTAHAVASTPAAPPAVPRGAPAGSAQDAAASAHFDHQLHAARQRHASHDAAPSPTGPGAREPGTKSHPSATRGKDAADLADAQTSTASAPATPPAAPTQAGEAAQPHAAETKAPADTAEVDDQPASALAGAMLALIGPSVAGVLRPAAAPGKAVDVLASAGKTVAADAGVATLLQLGDAASATAVAGNATPAATAGMLAAADGLLPLASIKKDSSPADATPAGALPVPATAPAPTTPPVLQLPSPVGSHAFAQDLGQQVAWLGSQGIKQARIRLHPEELGSLDVKVSVAHGRVDVVFSAQHPAAVAAVQQSLPQLDHMLSQHGLALGHAEVGQHDRGDRRGQAGEGNAAGFDEPGEIHAITMTSPGQVSLLDAFA